MDNWFLTSALDVPVSVTFWIWSFLLLVMIVFIISIPIYWWRNLGWLRQIQKMARRLKADEGEAVLAELLARRNLGDESADLAMRLSATYSFLGRGEEAEPLAHAVLDDAERRGLFNKSAMDARARCDLAMIALSDAWITQGRFTEAAHYLRPRVEQAVQPNFLTAIIAWSFFLGRDDDNARATLLYLQPVGNRFNSKKIIDRKYRMAVAYMRHRLLGDDTLDELRQLRDQIPGWEQELRYNAGNSYGARLREIVDDMKGLVEWTT